MRDAATGERGHGAAQHGGAGEEALRTPDISLKHITFVAAGR